MTAAASPVSAKANAMLFAAVAMWGSNVPLMKWLTGSFDPVLLSTLRMVAASGALALFLVGRAPVKRITPAQWRYLAVCGFAMVYLNQVFFLGGIARSTATNGTLMSATNALFGSLLAWLFLREHIQGRRMVGIAIGMAGVSLVILMRPGADLGHGGVGDLMMLAATISFVAGGAMVQRLAAEIDAVTISVGVHVAGALCLLLHLGAQSAWTGQWPQAPSSPWPWALALVSGAIVSGMGNLMWNRAIAIVGMARASVWTYWMPLFGVVVAVLFLGEPLTVWHVIGFILVLWGTRLSGR
jgi:drug/metabolite transporter (DMT)-like permease